MNMLYSSELLVYRVVLKDRPTCQKEAGELKKNEY
jgi:hypothetical protein